MDEQVRIGLNSMVMGDLAFVPIPNAGVVNLNDRRVDAGSGVRTVHYTPLGEVGTARAGDEDSRGRFTCLEKGSDTCTNTNSTVGNIPSSKG